MAINSYFYDSTDADPRPYSAADFAKAFGMILTDGVIAKTDGTLGFVIGGTNYTTIYDGRAVIQGHFVELTGTEVITVPPSSYAGLITIKVDMTDQRKASINVRTDRTPEQNAAVWEYPLYEITVTNGVISTLPLNVRAQGGAVAKTAANVPTWYPDPNGVVLKISNHEIFFTTAEPAKAAKRIWIQTV
jgi:hypothetical protein